jgi:hypothetical protein
MVHDVDEKTAVVERVGSFLLSKNIMTGFDAVTR